MKWTDHGDGEFSVRVPSGVGSYIVELRKDCKSPWVTADCYLWEGRPAGPGLLLAARLTFRFRSMEVAKREVFAKVIEAMQKRAHEALHDLGNLG